MKFKTASCGTYTCLVTYPINVVFSSLFFILTLTSIVGNTLVLATIFSPRNKRSSVLSNKFLISLAISCALVGYIASPLSGIQLLTNTLSSNKTIDEIRRFIHVWLLGTTFFLLGSIGYDRYNMLKQSNHANMTKQKVYMLLCISWIVPCLIPILRYLNKMVFFISILFVIIGTFIILCVVYCCIVMLVRKKEKNVAGKHIKLRKSARTTRDNEDVNTEIKENNVPKLGDKYSRRRSRKFVQLTKIVLVLLTCYLLCNVAGVCYFVATLIKYDFASLYTKQIALLCSELSAQLNSTLTPIVYFAFSSEFRKEFKKGFLFGRCHIFYDLRLGNTCCRHGSSTATSGQS